MIAVREPGPLRGAPPPGGMDLAAPEVEEDRSLRRKGEAAEFLHRTEAEGLDPRQRESEACTGVPAIPIPDPRRRRSEGSTSRPGPGSNRDLVANRSSHLPDPRLAKLPRRPVCSRRAGREHTEPTLRDAWEYRGIL